MLKLLKHMNGYKKECVLGPLLKLFEALLELLIPYVVLNMINNGVEKNDVSYIFVCVIILVGMGLLGLVFSLTAQYFSAKAAVGLTSKVREKLFAHIQHLSYSDIDRVGRSTLINRLTSDMNQIQTGVNLALRLFLRSPFIVFGAAIMAFTVDSDAAFVFVIAIPVLALVVFSIMLIGIPLYKKVQGNLDKITLKTRENLGGVRMLRALTKEENEKEEFKGVNDELSKTQRFVGKISSLMNPLTFAIINIAIAFLIYKGGVKVQYGLLTQAAVIALYNYMSQILVELIKLANLIISITKAVACGKRVQSVLDIECAVKDGNDSFSNVDKDFSIIKFDNVSFAYYNGGDPSIKNMSFEIKKGQTVGIIGGTGSGKSTLINLICRFYDVDDGQICIGTNNVKNIKSDELLSKIGLVPQKPALFKGTIRTNLLFGNENANDNDIDSALEASMAKEFVSKLDNGIDSEIEQFGSNLSGGQKQRLTIARALVRKPDILILDDSSSALDYATDNKLRCNIRNLQNKPTVIIVSQRYSAISDADKILVLDEGSLVGEGKHDELYNRCEVYKEICDSQMKAG